jgi:hypothetical protein
VTPHPALLVALVVAAGAVVGLLWVMLLLVASVPPFPQCGGCGDPMPMGYEAIHDGKPHCRSCCRRHDIRPWYYSDELWAARQRPAPDQTL